MNTDGFWLQEGHRWFRSFEGGGIDCSRGSQPMAADVAAILAETALGACHIAVTDDPDRGRGLVCAAAVPTQAPLLSCLL